MKLTDEQFSKILAMGVSVKIYVDKPEFVEKIFNGTKRYEYRKFSFKKVKVHTVVVYCTQPVGRLLANSRSKK
jgi:predicted transcriptional regulator